jgi:hypothetical protein
MRKKYSFIIFCISLITSLSVPGQARDEQRISSVGAVFTKDISVAPLGEAWREPSRSDGSPGLVWGDVVTNGHGQIQLMLRNQALRYCASFGARLPSQREYERLARYLGMGSRAGFETEVLPNLYFDSKYWSSEVDRNNRYYGVFFNAKSGKAYPSYNGSVREAVRCVVGG